MGRGSRWLLAALLAAGALGFALSVAAASSSGQPVFGIHPLLLGRTTLHHNHFSYALGAGSSVTDGVVLDNFTASALTLSVYPADMLQASGGGLAPAQPGVQHGVGAWLRVAMPSVTVPAFGQVTDSFRLVVPPGTVPGQYFGSVVASRSAGVTASGLIIQTRAALIVQVTVPGRIRVALSLSRPVAQLLGNAERISTTVFNRGTVLVTLARAALTVRGNGRLTVLPLNPAGLYVLPGGRATLTAVYGRLPWIGKLEITASLDAAVDGQDAGRYRSPTLVLRFVPWQPLASIAAALGALGLVTWLGRSQLASWWAGRREERRLVSDLRRQRRGQPRRMGEKKTKL